MSKRPRALWLRETLKATDDLLAQCYRCYEHDIIPTLMGTEKFDTLIAELVNLRAYLADQLKQGGPTDPPRGAPDQTENKGGTP